MKTHRSTASESDSNSSLALGRAMPSGKILTLLWKAKTHSAARQTRHRRESNCIGFVRCKRIMYTKAGQLKMFPMNVERERFDNNQRCVSWNKSATNRDRILKWRETKNNNNNSKNNVQWTLSKCTHFFVVTKHTPHTFIVTTTVLQSGQMLSLLSLSSSS